MFKWSHHWVDVEHWVPDTVTRLDIYQGSRAFLVQCLLVLLVMCVSGCGPAGLPLPIPDPRRSHTPHPNDEGTPEPLVVEETYDASFAEVWEASLTHLKENFTLLTEDENEGLIVTDRYTGAVWEQKFRECAGRPSGIDPPLVFLTVEIEPEGEWMLVRRISSSLPSKQQNPDVVMNQDPRYLRCLEQPRSSGIWSRTRIVELIDQRRMRLGTR